jgi:hypothetical protein
MADRITYVLLNGPSMVGKSDVVAPILCQELRKYCSNIHQDSFSAPLKHFIATALSARYNEMKKDVPVAELNGYSVREFVIDLSEQYLKVRYGEDVLGRLLHYRVLRINPIPRFVVVDSSGFTDERDALPRTVTIRVEREGFTFEGDSRSHLPDPDYTISNNGTIDELRAKLAQLAFTIYENH